MRLETKIHAESGRRTTRLGLAGAVAGALAASICCLGPLVLVALGATGAWIGGLAAIEPYRPLFILATVGLLGFAFYREYRKPNAEACKPGSACAVPAVRRRARAALWLVAALVLALLALPYVSPALVASAATGSSSGPTATVTLAVHNMTCDGCVATVTKALTAVPGVTHAHVTLEPPRAEVTYDPARVNLRQLAAATGEVGYPADVIAHEGGRR